MPLVQSTGLARWYPGFVGASLALVLGCGSRSPLKDKKAIVDAGPEPCVLSSDCTLSDRCQPMLCREGYCQPDDPIVCVDEDPCTEDLCDPATGYCLFRPYSYDLDGDGHRGPRPGTLPGAADSCGDDCNDQSPFALPGGVELCDGLDNDCNGVVDDLAVFKPVPRSSVRVTGSEYQAADGASLVFNGEYYGITFNGTQVKQRAYFKRLSRFGETVLPELGLTNVGSDSYAGPITWTGSVFATAWEDRRVANFEIFFNQLDPEGQKLGPDIQVSFGEDFSLHPEVLWNGREYLVVWDDQRFGEPIIMGQRITIDGQLVGENTNLTPESVGEAPLLVQGGTKLALIFKRGTLTNQTIAFRTVSPDFSELGPIIPLSSLGSVNPSAVFSGDRFVIAWSRRGEGSLPGDAIWATTMSETGEILRPEQRITEGAQFARSQTLMALGDRVVLIWVADPGTDNYDLYAKMMDLDFNALTETSRLTDTAAQTTGVAATFGPDGDIGVLFDDRTSGPSQAYFTRLTCDPNRL